MKKVTKYEAKDGNLFDSEQDCLQYEDGQKMIKRIEEELYLRDVSAEEIWQWITVNQNLINEILTVKKKHKS